MPVKLRRRKTSTRKRYKSSTRKKRKSTKRKRTLSSGRLLFKNVIVSKKFKVTMYGIANNLTFKGKTIKLKMFSMLTIDYMPNGIIYIPLDRRLPNFNNFKNFKVNNSNSTISFKSYVFNADRFVDIDITFSNYGEYRFIADKLLEVYKRR